MEKLVRCSSSISSGSMNLYYEIDYVVAPGASYINGVEVDFNNFDSVATSCKEALQSRREQVNLRRENADDHLPPPHPKHMFATPETP
eukprot:1340164-Amphidinium_carterae.1